MKTKTTSSVNVSVSLPSHLRELARQAAFDDNRSVSSLVAQALRSYLHAEGYLEDTPRPTANT